MAKQESAGEAFIGLAILLSIIHFTGRAVGAEGFIASTLTGLVIWIAVCLCIERSITFFKNKKQGKQNEKY